ncbi:MAG: deoxyribodipyrimidine photo-lyase, partial [Methylobacterium sp.]|nr:deoxyribodipyrimidine photo-lyase [Methylobacterium sp.]
HHALCESRQVYCVFVFDREILDVLPDRADRRVEFIWESVRELASALQARGGALVVLHAHAAEAIPQLAARLGVDAVYANRDYEPAAVLRDTTVAASLSAQGIAFHAFKDQVIFERDEILTQSGKPYGVFTPYKNAWLKRLTPEALQPLSTDLTGQRLAKPDAVTLPSLEALGFRRTNMAELPLPAGMRGGAALFEDFQERIARYDEARNFPAVKGPSYLSVHLRFGTVSIRHLARTARQRGGRGAETWLNELIWRDFYFQVLHHRPQIASGAAFKPEFEHIRWPGSAAHFEAWCAGVTGYPLVDAAMRQLNQTGYMHNRLRMVAASFLCKDLGLD